MDKYKSHPGTVIEHLKGSPDEVKYTHGACNDCTLDEKKHNVYGASKTSKIKSNGKSSI